MGTDAMVETSASTVWGSRLCWAAIGLCGLALLLILISGPGTRMGLFGFRLGLLVYVGAVLLTVLALVAGLAGLGMTRGTAGGSPMLLAWGAVIVSALLSWNNFNWYQMARSVPPIHDITTDTTNPPAFVDVLPLRADAANPPEYQGAEIADQQTAAYPDIVPIETDASPASVYAAALKSVESLGWALAGSDEASGRVEATDTTFWFGFKDDVVIRITPTADGSRVDVRSKSRVGLGDIGTNAARVRSFRDQLLAEIG